MASDPQPMFSYEVTDGRRMRKIFVGPSADKQLARSPLIVARRAAGGRRATFAGQ